LFIVIDFVLRVSSAVDAVVGRDPKVLKLKVRTLEPVS